MHHIIQESGNSPFKKNGESLGSLVSFSRIRPRVVLGWVGEICHNPWSARHATWLCIGLFQQCNRFCAMPIELATRDFPWLQIEFPSSAQQQAAIHVEGKTLPKLFSDCRIVKGVSAVVQRATLQCGSNEKQLAPQLVARVLSAPWNSRNTSMLGNLCGPDHPWRKPAFRAPVRNRGGR